MTESSRLTHPQIRAGWGSTGAVCMLLNLSVTKPNTLVTLASNIILLVIMLIGLLSNHLYDSNAYSIGRLLWKQVRRHRVMLSGVLHRSPSVDMFSILKGLIWLLIATFAEVLPAVCSQFHVQIIPLIASMSQVFICLNLNSKFHIHLVC